jgi:di/tripeptidase
MEVFKSSQMDFVYDIFEKLPDGKVIWRFSVTGRDNAIAQFEQIAAISSNEVFVMQVDTQEVIVRKLP